MPSITDIEAAIRSASSKREVAETLGMTPSAIYLRLMRAPELGRDWRRLPSDGAYEGGYNDALPAPTRDQAELDALVKEASRDCPLNPARPERHNAVLLLLAMFNIAGTLSFKRGWARSAMIAFDEAGCRRPSSGVIRWYRSSLRDDPFEFAHIPGVDPTLLQDIDDHGHYRLKISASKPGRASGASR